MQGRINAEKIITIVRGKTTKALPIKIPGIET